MQIELDREQAAYIRQQVESGTFDSDAAVIREALSLKMRLETRHPRVEPHEDLEELCYLEAMVACDDARYRFTEECRHEVGG